MPNVIAVSGPIAVGKSAVISWLQARANVARISTREVIQSLWGVTSERTALQEAGDALDRETDGKWVADVVAERAAGIAADTVVVVDSVRTAKQVEHLRNRFGKKLFHVHLTASRAVLEGRFASRKAKGNLALKDVETYEEALANDAEAQIETLGPLADKCINTDRLDPASVAVLAFESLGLFPPCLTRSSI